MITYGMESVNLTNANLKQLRSVQGSIIKSVMGIPKRSHHSGLFEALRIPTTDELVRVNTSKLYHRIFSCESPASEIQQRFLTNYLTNNEVIPGTLIQRLLSQGASPVNSILNAPRKYTCRTKCHDNGIVDSLQSMLFHDNYIKPHSNEHMLTVLLLRAF